MPPARKLPPPHSPVAIYAEDKFRNLRRLIWLYFWLLLFEGALRKWVLPQLSNPLLIIRDPVVLLIYVLAIRARVFPRNAWVLSLAIIAFLSLAVSFIALWQYIPPDRIILISGYGFRANFLHLPLIFLMPRVLRPEDVKRIGWWVLLLVVPMALLMVAQFRAAPDSLLNRTASGEGEQIVAALGKVRTAGTFSFVVGVVAYFALATGFLVWAALKRGVYRNLGAVRLWYRSPHWGLCLRQPVGGRGVCRGGFVPPARSLSAPQRGQSFRTGVARDSRPRVHCDEDARLQGGPWRPDGAV